MRHVDLDERRGVAVFHPRLAGRRCHLWWHIAGGNVGADVVGSEARVVLDCDRLVHEGPQVPRPEHFARVFEAANTPIGSVKEGFGVLVYQNGDKYEGEFKNNMFNGNGEMTKKDGTVEKGLFKNHVFVGDD